MDGERSSPRKSNSQRSTTPRQQQQQQTPKPKPSDTIYGTGMQDEEFDAVGGLLRSIQKPLSSIGRIFSDDGAESNSSNNRTPPPMPPRSTTSPFPGNNNSHSDEQRQQVRAEHKALQRASVEAEESRKARAKELRLVVE